MIKRLCSIFIISLCMFFLLACGDKTDSDSTSTPEVTNVESDISDEVIEPIKEDAVVEDNKTDDSNNSSGEENTDVIESKVENNGSKWKANCPYVPASEF